MQSSNDVLKQVMETDFFVTTYCVTLLGVGFISLLVEAWHSNYVNCDICHNKQWNGLLYWTKK